MHRQASSRALLEPSCGYTKHPGFRHVFVEPLSISHQYSIAVIGRLDSERV